jgi:phosphate transport system protein
MIALQKPAPSDMRFLIAALRLDTDFERIGELVVNIAERVAWLAASPMHRPNLELAPMASTVQTLLFDALWSLDHSDTEAARQILARNATVDKLFAANFDVLAKAIQRAPVYIECAIRLLFIAKHLERIADHATHIAEMVIYIVDGKDVRRRVAVASI